LEYPLKIKFSESNNYICFVLGTLGQGGAERQFFYIARTLINRQVRFFVITFSRNEFWERSLKDLGVNIEYVDVHSRLLRVVSILRLIQKYKPNLLYSTHFFTNAYVGLAGRLFGIKSIGSIRGNGEHDLKNSGIFRFLNLFSTSFIVANSKNAINYLTMMFPSKLQIELLPNVVEKTPFFLSKQRSENVNLVMLGRLAVPKRFDILINVFAEIINRGYTNTRLFIVGDGVLGEGLKILVGNIPSLAGYVTFTGALIDPFPFLCTMDIMVHLSDHEGLPNAIMEGMICGLPIIASNVGGIPELVDDGKNGFLVNNQDQDSIADKIEQALRSPSLRQKFGEDGSRKMKQGYSLQHFEQNLFEIFERVGS